MILLYSFLVNNFTSILCLNKYILYLSNSKYETSHQIIKIKIFIVVSFTIKLK